MALLLTVAAFAAPVAAHAAAPPATDHAAPRTSLPGSSELVGKFVPVTPKRVMDTRDGTGLRGRVAPVDPSSPATLDLRDITGNPAVTANAVVLNVTVTNGTADSFVTAAYSPYSGAGTSNVNFAAGTTVANLVTVNSWSDVYFFNHAGTVDVVADIFGYYTTDTAAGALTTMPPTRILDTRDGGHPVGPGGTLALPVAGVGSVPATGVTAVQLNVTATNTTGDSFLSVFPGGTPVPDISNMNYRPGQTVGNSVIVPVGADGKIDFWNHLGNVDVVVDISGYFTAGLGSALHVYNTRALDTRDTGGPIGAGQSRQLDIGAARPPGEQAGTPSAVVLNVTATNPTASSFLTVYPDGMPAPTASNLNFLPGQTLSNHVVAPVGADGKIDIYNHVGAVDVVVDLIGWYQPDTGLGISAVGFSQSTVDATSGTATVDVNWTVTDADPQNQQISGAIVLRQAGDRPGAYVGQSYAESFYYSHDQGGHHVAGTPQNSSYRYTFTVPSVSGSTTARWVVTQVYATDGAGRVLLAAGTDLDPFQATLTATTNVDSTPPTYQNVTFGGAGVNHRQYIYGDKAGWDTFHLEVKDAAAGVWRGEVTLAGPGGQTLTGRFEHYQQDGGVNGDSVCSGDDHDLQCPVQIVFPQGVPAGRWSIAKIVLTDNAGSTATYDHLDSAPVTVADNRSISAHDFDITPKQVDNWRHDADVTVSMRVDRARQGIQAIYVDAYVRGEWCQPTSATPTLRPDGSYAITIVEPRGIPRCQVTGIAVLDGAGDLALYGLDYWAPDPNLLAGTMPDTTPPVITSAAVAPASVPAGQPITVTAHSELGIAPIFQAETYLYDGAGRQVADVYSDFVQGDDGLLTFPAKLPALPAGSYTVGFKFQDTGWLQTEYGTPGGNPMPGGPITLTVTEG